MLDSDEKKFTIVMVCGVLLLVVTGLVDHYVCMMPHVDVAYVVGYHQGYTVVPFKQVPITKIMMSYRVVETGEDDQLITKTFSKIYANHYNFSTGELYKISSEGNFWWWFRVVTEVEIVSK